MSEPMEKQSTANQVPDSNKRVLETVFRLSPVDYTDSIRYEVSETMLTTPPGKQFFTPKCDIKGFEGYQWAIACYPNGFSEEHKGNVSVYLHVYKLPVYAKWHFTIPGTDAISDSNHHFTTTDGRGTSSLITHESLRFSGAIKNGVFTICCDAIFTLDSPAEPECRLVNANPCQIPAYNMLKKSDYDFTFVVSENGNEKDIKAHQGFLALISPVFRAMFTHDTKEKKTGTLNMVDCEYTVIKEVIDMSYGHPMKATTVNEVLELLTFADKYEISTVLEELLDWLANNLTVATFGTIATYAWKYSTQQLKEECRSFYKKHPHVSLTAGFRELDADIIVNIIQTES